MAKRIKEDDLPFDVPKFDEDEFVRKELISFKTTAILFGFTLAVAIATFLLWRATGLAFFPLLLVAMIPAVLLKPAYRALKIDVGHWGKKEWVGTYLLYFLFWLGFTLLAVNPPFSDSAAPAIDMAASPQVQDEGFPIRFEALVRDNKDLDEESIVFCLHAYTDARPPTYAALSTEQQDACRVDWEELGDGRYSYTLDGDPGDYVWFVTAADTAGQTQEANGTVRVGAPFRVLLPGGSGSPNFDEATDRLIVEPDSAFGTNIRAMQYTMGDPENPETPWHNMVYDADAIPPHWYTNPRFPAWQPGDNLVTIRALEHPHYLDQERIEPGVARLADGTYNITVDAGLPVNTEGAPDIPARENPQRVVTPGPGVPVTLVALVGLLVVVGRRRG